MRISHLESFCLVSLTKKFIWFAESERSANKLKPTNCHRDRNYKTVDLMYLIEYSTRLCTGSLNQYLYIKNTLSLTREKI